MKNPKSLELTEQQLERIAQRKKRDETSKVTPEWRLVSEFGTYYGWSGVEAVMNNDIDIYTFNDLLTGARKIWAGKLVELSTVIYTSVGATKSKKPKTVLSKGMAEFIKETK